MLRSNICMRVHAHAGVSPICACMTPFVKKSHMRANRRVFHQKRRFQNDSTGVPSKIICVLKTPIWAKGPPSHAC